MAVLLALIAFLRLAQLKNLTAPETSRKLLHIGMGLTVLSFPWIFTGPAPAFILAGGACLMLLAVRLVPSLKGGVGQVMHKVSRDSWGEIVYPLAVALTFWLSHGNSVYYVISILILTLADAVAAIIGVTYGKNPYESTDGRKSWEGSCAFFLAAFFSAHVPLLLFTALGRLEVLLISIILGLILMVVEAISWHGLDNLFLPLLTLGLLQRFEALPPGILGIRLAVLIALLIFCWSWRNRSSLRDAALLGSALFGYAAWTLGGPLWLLPAVTFFLLHTLVWPIKTQTDPRHDFWALVAVVAPGGLWLFVHLAKPHPIAALAFASVFACHLTFVGVSWTDPALSLPRRAPRCLLWCLLAAVLIWAPFALTWGWSLPPSTLLTFIAAGLAPILVGCLAFEILTLAAPPIGNPVTRIHWRGALASLLGSSAWLLVPTSHFLP
jgi:phytol kinase